jgi:hypothetical protein
MNSLFLEVQLLTDVAVTETSATIGGHRTLPYVPGSQLLGALARVAYASIQGASHDLAFRVFHSGEVRFGNALPASASGEPGLPMPFSLHLPKGTDRIPADGKGVRALNASRKAIPRGLQYRDIRTGFVTRSGERVETRRRGTLRTAVDESGRARDGLLFGLTGLSAGQRLLARIDADDPALLESVRLHLCGREIRIGRSRAAEYGLAAIRERDPWSEPRASSASTQQLLLWCVSDLALRCPESGQPTLSPCAKHLGLPGSWSMVPSQSFLRTRRYSPFNGYRGRPDLERQVIAAGSVLVFRGSEPVSISAVEDQLRAGVGDYLQDGLGQVLVEPALLADEEPELVAANRDAQPSHVASPRAALVSWLEGQEQQARATDKAWDHAQTWLRTLRAKVWKRISAAQWGEIRIIARRARGGRGNLVEDLRRFTTEGVRAQDDRWGARSNQRTLSEILCGWAQEPEDPQVAVVAIELLATHAVRQLRARDREQ